MESLFSSTTTMQEENIEPDLLHTDLVQQREQLERKDPKLVRSFSDYQRSFSDYQKIREKMQGENTPIADRVAANQYIS